MGMMKCLRASVKDVHQKIETLELLQSYVNTTVIQSCRNAIGYDALDQKLNRHVETILPLHWLE